jgi:DNA-binding transcriptional MerR regulator
MYAIGTVARLAQVSVRTLRYYDEIGLLRPMWTDPDTGHRWYAPRQMKRLHHIMALRDLGVALIDIDRLLGGGVSTEELRGILLLRRAEANERLAAETDRLTRVEARLAELQGSERADFDVIVKSVDAIWAAAASERLVEVGHIGEIHERLWPRVHAALDATGLERTGPSVAIETPTDDPRQPIQLMTAVPVPDGTVMENGGISTLEIPALARAAVTVIAGDGANAGPDFLGGWAALRRWAETTRSQTSGEFRELYLDCDGPRTTWVVEVQLALAD